MAEAAGLWGGVFAKIEGTAARVAATTGWRRALLGFGLGAAATLALPPLNFLPLVYLVLPGLVWLVPVGAGRRVTAFLAGWWFGFGYYVIGLYWLGNALLTFADKHAWLLPFANLGLPAFLACFTGAATLAAGFFAGTVRRAIALALALAVMDWLRGHVLTGFPWNLFGHAWAGHDALIQAGALVGVYGLGLAALLSAALPAGLIEGSRRARLVAAAIGFSILAGVWIGGSLRLAGARDERVANVGLRLVQANIPQREKWRRELRDRNLGLHYRLSLADRPAWVTHVIWPEMAATLYLEESGAARRAFAPAVPRGGALITGTPRRRKSPRQVHNSIVALDGQGEVIATYDKAHLVPFGEYVPLAELLPIGIISGGPAGYTPGAGRRTLRLPGLPPLSPLICYEVIFPGAVVDPRDRPSLLLNLTNDAWYGLSAGPYQHLAIARLRAVEEGLPLVRSAYTGISAVVDGYGRVTARLGLNERGFLDVRLPAALDPAPLYGRHGDLLFLFLAILSGIALRIRVGTDIASRDGTNS